MLLSIIIREIRHRRLNFLLSILTAAAAVAVLTAAFNLLASHDLRTEKITAEKEAELMATIDAMTDDFRKITKRMGFNILILPKQQELSDMWARDFAEAAMPEGYVKILSESKIMTVRHLLPALQQKIFWPEGKTEIILIGIRGEVPFMHKTPKQPILKPVKPGMAVIGRALCDKLKLEKDDSVAILGRSFKVAECLDQRGSKDDITIWIDLDQAQELLDKEDLINGIWALECSCAWADLDKVRDEITAILPDTQVIEKSTQALARAEARRRVAEDGKALILAEQAKRAELKQEKENLASILVPLSIVGAGILIGLLAFSNTRDRRSEVGILRAVGTGTVRIVSIFIIRAFLAGLLGGLIGYGLGIAAAARWSEAPLWMSGLFLAAVIGAPFLSVVAAWIPALAAAGQDPADILRREK